MPITGLFKKLVSVDRDIGNERKASENLSYRNLWLFNLVVRRERLKDKAQIYFPEARYIFKRVYEPKNILEGSTDKDRTAICVEVCYNKGDEIESMKEGELYSRVLVGLKDFYNITETDIEDMWSKKVPYAYSIYELGYKEKLKKLAQYLFEIENLISFGRQGSFRYNHMTNRIMDACNTLHNFLTQEKSKKDLMISPDPKSSFF
jgi:protoporphyrinogen oxidase